MLLDGDVVRFTLPWTKKKKRESEAHESLGWYDVVDELCGQSPPSSPPLHTHTLLLLPLVALCDSAVNNQNFFLLSPLFVSNFLISMTWSMIVCCCDSSGTLNSGVTEGECWSLMCIGACHKRLLLIYIQLSRQLSRSCLSILSLLWFVHAPIVIDFVCLTSVGLIEAQLIISICSFNTKLLFLANDLKPVGFLCQPLDLCFNLRCQTACSGSVLNHITGYI